MRHGSVALLACLLMLPVSASASSMHEAQQALEAGRPAAAADMLRQQLQTSPRNYEAWFLLGVAETRDRHYQRAINAFRRVIELQPALAEPHENLAAIYNQLDDVPAAVQELEQSLNKRPGHAGTEASLGDLHLKLALDYYRRSLAGTKDPVLAARYTRLLQVRDPAVASVQTAGLRVAAGQVQKKAEEKPEVPQETAQPPVTVAEARPVQAKAEEKPQPDGRAAVAAAVETWRKAWSDRNLSAYFAAYADNYRPGGRFSTLAAWKQYKSRVIGNKKFIKVEIEDLQVKVDGHTAQAKFRQHFRSDTFQGDDDKVLTLKMDDRGWKIVREASK